MTVGHFINGKPVPGTSGRQGNVYDPATGQVTKRVALANQSEVGAAIAAAAEAFPAWAATPPARRAKVMFRLKQLIEEHASELAGLITAEHGKVLNDAMGSIARALEIVDFACGIPHLAK